MDGNFSFKNHTARNPPADIGQTRHERKDNNQLNGFSSRHLGHISCPPEAFRSHLVMGES
jgi:hypothetical protein